MTRSQTTGLPDLSIDEPIPLFAPRPSISDVPADVNRFAVGFVAFLVAVFLASIAVLAHRPLLKPQPKPWSTDGGVR